MRYTGFRDKPGMTGTQWVLIEAEWATYRRAQREYRETRWDDKENVVKSPISGGFFVNILAK
jgi:hypothetical protein